MEVSLAALFTLTPPGVVRVAQARPAAQAVKGQERDSAETLRFMGERRAWRAVIEAECLRLEGFLKTCTFD